MLRARVSFSLKVESLRDEHPEVRKRLGSFESATVLKIASRKLKIEMKIIFANFLGSSYQFFLQKFTNAFFSSFIHEQPKPPHVLHCSPYVVGEL